MGDSVLGPMTGREKTDVRVPKDLAKAVDKLAHDLGVPKNAFYVMGAALLTEQLLGVQGGTAAQKRKALAILSETLAAIEAEIKAA